MKASKLSFGTLYLLLTPAFMALDLLLGWNVRAYFFDGNALLKWGYYLLCFALGVASLIFPSLKNIISLAENVLNIFLLTADTATAYFTSVGSLLEVDPEIPIAKVEFWINYILTGVVLTREFYHNPIVKGGRTL